MPVAEATLAGITAIVRVVARRAPSSDCPDLGILLGAWSAQIDKGPLPSRSPLR
ncbi:MAG: hypothetical protein KDA22_15390 [Phycisphaerales bacterium]|nr:hypothetical protein [Phycisphaerales bacterium]